MTASWTQLPRPPTAGGAPWCRRGGGRRSSRWSWSEARALRLDPRVGPRILRAETAYGVLVELPLLDEDGTEAVLAAHAAHAAARERR